MQTSFVVRAALAVALGWACLAPPARAQFGGAMGGAGGFGGGAGGEQAEVPLPKARAPMTAAAARTWRQLQRKVEMPFAKETPLSDVLNYVRDASHDKDEKGGPLAFYVDPIALQEAEKTENSPLTIQLDGLPLATSLDLALKQLGLTFYVRPDGLVHVTNTMSSDMPDLLVKSVAPVSAEAARTWEALFQPISMPFANETPLEDVIKYIKSATTNPELPEGLPVYVEPKGLQAAEKTEQSPVRLRLEGMPLAVTLRLMLQQLDLAYHVDESGLLIITDEATARTRTTPAANGERTAQLESEIEALRKEVETLKARPNAQPAPKAKEPQ